MKLADAVDPPEDKPIDPHLALEKLIRLDRKHTNFDYVDSSRNAHFKVQYPPVLNDAPSNDHLLRQFWRHSHNYYFRSLEEPEIQRLDYFSSILEEKISDELPFRSNSSFWKELEGIFDPSYLQRQVKEASGSLESQNWLCTLYLYNHALDNQEGKSHKKLKQDLVDLKQSKKILQPLSSRGRYKESLKAENAALRKLLPDNEQENDDLHKQIQNFRRQLEQKYERTSQLLQKLKDRVMHEEIQKSIIYCFGDEEYDIPMKEPAEYRDQIILWSNISEVQVEKKYLELCIEKLEKKQVAESLSKIVKVEKFKNQTKYVVSFEEAMNVKKKIMTEKELLELNKLRQYSLMKFYNTSLKTPYSFICQNFLGFREIYLNRNKPCIYKNKNMLEEIKKAVHQPMQTVREFEKFDICHHCKLLYPETFLTKCKYASEKVGIPVQPAPYVDPYITQISKLQTSSSERYMVRRRNCYQNYTKIDEEYVCKRKFCKYCLRQNYEDGIDKNGLCPFCQGICFCTRCTRNQMITRLKSIYVLLGGQVSKLHSQSLLQIESNETDEQETTSVRKKGRPKKIIRRNVNTNQHEVERLNKIRMDLQPLRILCDMVKKREKLKLRNLETEREIFHEKMKMLGWQLGKQKEVDKEQKLKKKLRRMI